VNEAAALRHELAVRAGSRRKLTLEAVWTAFLASVPGYLGAPDARSRLAELLQTLEAEGFLVRPRGRVHWDATGAPALPRWIRLSVSAPVSSAEGDHRMIAWAPELAFASDLARTAVHRDLLAIQQFLASGGRQRPFVPLRERSADIFGDEKRLDSLVSTQVFGPGRLSLEMLRCFEVMPPLTWEPGRPEAPPRLLVIENLHTFDSFRRWNGICPAYAAVAYGHGNQFLKTARDLPRLITQLGIEQVEYFGDLDRRGLEIASRAADLLAPLGTLLRPATRWYRTLLDEGDRFLQARAPRGASADTDRKLGAELDWLPSELRLRAAALLQRGLRLPQELVGWQHLENLTETQFNGGIDGLDLLE
jgi:hypothetical protein